MVGPSGWLNVNVVRESHSKIQDSLDQCPILINADQNPGIDPKYLSMPINVDQFRADSLGLSWPLWINFRNRISRDQYWSATSIDLTCVVIHLLGLVQPINIWHSQGKNFWAFPGQFWIDFGYLVFKDQHWSASSIGAKVILYVTSGQHWYAIKSVLIPTFNGW